MKSKRYSLSDRIALLRLSCRHYYWNISFAGKGSVTLKRIGELFACLANSNYLAFMAHLGAIVIVFYAIFVNFLQTIEMLFDLPAYIANGKIVGFIGVIIVRLAMMALGFSVLLNPKRLKRSRRYRESAFFKNTGIMPREVVKDKGLCGEYLATCYEEEELKRSGIKGHVFNSVIIPHRGGNFSEADVVSVSEMGINVIEVKALGGEIKGGATDDKWVQTMGRETYEFTNPIVQNLQHMNALLSYLNDRMCKDDFLFANTPLFALSYDTVLFIDNNVNLDIDTFRVPNLSYFYGNEKGYKGYYDDTIKEVGHIFEKDELNYFANILKELSSHTPAEIDHLMADRQAAIDRGEFRYPSTYYIADCTFDNFDEKSGGICLIKEQNGVKYYFDPKDNWFKYFGSLSVDNVLGTYHSYEEAMRAFSNDALKSRRYYYE